MDAFRSADQVLLSGVQGITDLITTPGLINLDFADVKSVMSGAGSALMGIGAARGDNRARQAAEIAIASPLLEASMEGAHGVLLSIYGGSDLGLFEINEAASLVAEAAHPDANIIFGAVIDDTLGDEVKVTVIAAGFDSGQLPYKKVDIRRETGRAEPRRPAAGHRWHAAGAARPGEPTTGQPGTQQPAPQYAGHDRRTAVRRPASVASSTVASNRQRRQRTARGPRSTSTTTWTCRTSSSPERLPTDEHRQAELVTTLGAVRSRIAAACAAVGRDPRDVTLIAVTKTCPVSDIVALAALGVVDVGESKDQEARRKIAELDDQVPRDCAGTWSGGCRPTRRAASRRTPRRCTRSTAPKLVARARRRPPTGRTDAPLDVFVQVSLDDDPDRGGAPVGELLPLAAERWPTGPQLRLRGVMAVPPLGAATRAPRSRGSPSCRPGCAPSIRRPTRSRPA